jgi:signal transduction histidine kinase
MSLFVIVVLYLVCLQRPVFAENVMPSDIGESYIIQDTVENVSADSSSFKIFILLGILLLAVAIAAYFFVMKYKKVIDAQKQEMNAMLSLGNEKDSQIRTKEGQIKQVQAAYAKIAAQRKEMKGLFAAEYDKLVKKYRALAQKQATAPAAAPVENSELEEATKTLEQTQTLLIQAEKMSSLGQLTAGIAHEINNPVNFVANGINTLKENVDQLNVFIDNYKKICELDTFEEMKKYYKIQREDDEHFDELQTSTQESLDDVEYGTKRITEIVNGLRVFARQDESDINEADVNQILENAIVILKPKYKKKAKILKNFDDNIGLIKCLPGQLNQALVNIIGNACDAIEFKGTINVKSKELDEANFQIFIKDDGKGMSEATTKKIFDPFFTTKAVGKGTGLGMSITYGIIEKHNGKIEVQSEEGKGTEFIITLPKKLKKIKKPDAPNEV